MRAVWSFWSKPFRAHHRQTWLTGRHHLLAWVLSVETARRHYPLTTLVTDDEGARLLIDLAGLRFTTVSTALNALQDADPQWWVLGKLWTYRTRTAPFVHIDSDVFLWNQLPARVQQAPVFAQNPESFSTQEEEWYRPRHYDTAISAAGGWTPEEWRWYTDSRGNQAACCGIVGGSAVEFLSHYAGLAIRMIEHPANRRAWAALGSTIGDNILLEQYLFSACLGFHRQSPLSPFRGIEAAYLFDSPDEAFDEQRAAVVGYTHLIGEAKRNCALLDRLEARVARDYPAEYEACLRVDLCRQ